MSIDQRALDILYLGWNPAEVGQVARTAEEARNGSRAITASPKGYRQAAADQNPVIRQKFLDGYGELNPSVALLDILYWPVQPKLGQLETLNSTTSAATWGPAAMMGLCTPTITLYFPEMFKRSFQHFRAAFVHEGKHASDFYYGLPIPLYREGVLEGEIMLDHTNAPAMDSRLLDSILELSACQASLQYATASGLPRAVIRWERDIFRTFINEVRDFLSNDPTYRLFTDSSLEHVIAASALHAAKQAYKAKLYEPRTEKLK